MASLRQVALKTAESLRGLTAPSKWDYRTVKVTVVRRVWSGGEAGAGSIVDTVLTDLPQAIRVAPISERLIAGPAGRYEAGDIKIGPITPAWSVGASSGGYTPAQLDPAATLGTTGTEIVYVLTGTVAGEYRLIDLQTHKAVSYFLTLRRLRSTP